MKEEKKKKSRRIVLSENKSAKYKIIKIKQIEQTQKRKVTASSSAVQSQNKNDAAQRVAAINNSSNNNRRKNTSTASAVSTTKNTTPENKNGDKYKNVAKINLVKDQQTSNSKQDAIQKQNTVNTVTTANVQITRSSETQTDRYKAKAAEISGKMQADVNKARSASNQLENQMRIFAIMKARQQYKAAHLSKGTSSRFNSAIDNTVKKEASNDPEYLRNKEKAALHYKKMEKLDRKITKLDKRAKAAEERAERNEKLLRTVQKAAILAKSPKEFVKEEAKEVINKTKLGSAALRAGSDFKAVDEAANANSLAEGTSAAFTALPEKYIKETAVKTVQNVATGKSHAKNLEKQKKNKEKHYEFEKAKAERAERQAKAAKESAMLKAKVQFYKEEKGLVKSSSTVKNIKRDFKKASDGLSKLAKKEGGKAIIALVGALVPVLLVFLIIIAVIAALFAWTQPHAKEVYNDETERYEIVEFNTDVEVLKGYVKYIQQYIDEKQLEILEIVDFDFGGFEPDEYDYTNVKNTTSHLYQYRPYAVYAQRVTSGQGGSSDPTEVSTNTIYCEYYYKKYPDGIYKCMPDDAEQTYTIMEQTVSIEKLVNKYAINYDGTVRERNPAFSFDKQYTFDNGVLYNGMDITNVIITQYDGNTVVKSAPATQWIAEYAELYARVDHNMSTHAENGITVKYSDFILKTSGLEPNPPAEDTDALHRIDNHIWSLNQIENKWIKVSDYCDIENIIAMAAIKKFDDITADNFDSETYDFSINEDDLDAVLNEIYTFDYNYAQGKCPERDCHREMGAGGVWVYSCNKTHTILKGGVQNWEYMYDNEHGDISFVKNKLNITGDKEAIYEAYKEYISDVLGGTSTKLDDYENSLVAQRRLQAMYEAEHGKRPDTPKNLRHTVVKDYYVDEEGNTDPEMHYYVMLTWDAVEDADTYTVYEYNRMNDKFIRKIGNTSSNSLTFDLGTLCSTVFDLDESGAVSGTHQEYQATTRDYLVIASNENGNSKHEQSDAYQITVVPDELTT